MTVDTQPARNYCYNAGRGVNAGIVFRQGRQTIGVKLLLLTPLPSLKLPFTTNYVGSSKKFQRISIFHCLDVR